MSHFLNPHLNNNSPNLQSSVFSLNPHSHTNTNEQFKQTAYFSAEELLKINGNRNVLGVSNSQPLSIQAKNNLEFEDRDNRNCGSGDEIQERENDTKNEGENKQVKKVNTQNLGIFNGNVENLNNSNISSRKSSQNDHTIIVNQKIMGPDQVKSETVIIKKQNPVQIPIQNTEQKRASIQNIPQTVQNQQNVHKTSRSISSQTDLIYIRNPEPQIQHIQRIIIPRESVQKRESFIVYNNGLKNIQTTNENNLNRYFSNTPPKNLDEITQKRIIKRVSSQAQMQQPLHLQSRVSEISKNTNSRISEPNNINNFGLMNHSNSSKILNYRNSETLQFRTRPSAIKPQFSPRSTLPQKGPQIQLININNNKNSRISPVGRIKQRSISQSSNQSKSKPIVHFTYSNRENGEKNEINNQRKNQRKDESKQKYEQQLILVKKQLKSCKEELQDYKQQIQQLEKQNKDLNEQLKQHRKVPENYIQIIREQQQIIKQQKNQLDLQKTTQKQQNSEMRSQNFAELVESYSYKEQQFKIIIKNQQLFIQELEQQLKKYSKQLANRQKQRQQTSQIQLQNAHNFIQKLQSDLENSQIKTSELKQQLLSKINELNSIKQQRIKQQQIFVQLQIRVHQLEQQLSQNHLNVQNPSSIPPTPIVMQNQQATQSRVNQNSSSIVQNSQLLQLMEENDRIMGELRKKQQSIRRIQEQYIEKQELNRRKLLEKQSQIRLFNDQISVLEEEYKKRSFQKDNRIKILEEQLQTMIKNMEKGKKNQNLFSDNFNFGLPNNQVRSLRQKLTTMQDELYEAKKVKQNIEKKYQNLQINFAAMQQQVNRKSNQLLTFKRQYSGMGALETQIKTLTENIKKKNEQIIQLKTVSFQRNELKAELQSLKNERQVLRSTITSKLNQIEQLRRSFNELDAKLRETKLKQSLFPNTNQSVADQLKMMYDSVKNKQIELKKTKQEKQHLQALVEDLKYDLERNKNKQVASERNYGHEKQDWFESSKAYEGRIKDLQVKVKGLEELNKATKLGLEKQIITLETINKQRDDQIRKLEGENKVLKNKLKNHDSKVQEVDLDREALNQKIRQLETKKQEMKKQITNLQETGQNNNTKLFDDYTIKIVELESILKLKDNKIKQLENTIQTLKITVTHSQSTTPQNQQGKLQKQQMKMLRKKISQYEMRLLKGGFGSKVRDFESISIFEDRIIYDLKLQNQRLRKLLGGAEKGNKLEGGQNQQSITQIQKKLVDFKNKLQEIIQENQKLQQSGDFAEAILSKQTIGKEILSSFERQRLNILKKHKNQITKLQQRLIDLQRYCASLQKIQINSNNNQQKNITKVVENEQLTFYRQKNKQLQDRVDNHLKLNKQLKQKIQALTGKSNDNNSDDFYKTQNQLLEKKIQQNQNSIKTLTQENMRLLNQVQNLSGKFSEQKQIQTQNKLNQTSFKMKQIQIRNTVLQANLAQILYKQKKQQQALQKTQLQLLQEKAKCKQLENILTQTNKKYQSEYSNFKYQISYLQNVNSEYSDAKKKSFSNFNKSEQSDLIKYKAIINKLQFDLKTSQAQAKKWNETKNTYNVIIGNLNAKIQQLQFQMERLNKLYDNLNKKAKQGDLQMYDYESRLKNQREKRMELEKYYHSREMQYQGLRIFKDQIQRQKQYEESQKKNRMVYVTDMQQTIKTLREANKDLYDQITKTKADNQRQKKAINQLTNYIESLEAQSGITEVQGVAYGLEFLRSLFIQIDTMNNEHSVGQTSRERDIFQKIKESVEIGLAKCEETFSML